MSSRLNQGLNLVFLVSSAQEDVELPRILEKPQSITVKEGDIIRLEVFASGHPTPEIAWLKDNVLLRPEINPDFR